MARSFTVYQGEDETPEFDLTDATSPVHVVWEQVEAGGRAFRGESDISTIVIRDEQGETGNELLLPSGLDFISLSRGSRWVWLDGVDGGEVVMASGRIGAKDYSRGRQKADRAREVSMQGGDRNEELTEIIIDDWVRGEETDVARVLALLADYLDGSPRPTTVIADTYVAAGNTISMPAKTYDGTNPKEVLAEIAAYANKNFFVTVDDELWYDVNTSDSYVAGLRISDRPDEWTNIESEVGPDSFRVYPTNGSPGALVAPAVSAIWEGGGAELTLMNTSPVDSVNGPNTSVSGDVEYDIYLYRGVMTLTTAQAALMATGGTIHGQIRANARNGIGINESAQDHISQITVRVTVGNSTTVRGTAYAGHDLSSSAGSVKWPAQPTYVNSAFPPAAATQTFDAVSGAVAGDNLIIELGYRTFNSSATPHGGGIWRMDFADSDLPLDESTPTNLNSWIQFGPLEDIVPTFPPKWDVGPSSTEDGLELVSGLRLYYGQAGAYVYVNDPTTEASYWHAERSFYTQDPAINDATKATVLAETILDRLRFEERTYNVSVGPLYDEHVSLLKPGQLIDIKARAIPDADDQYVTRRIAQLRWTTPRAGVFWARMQLDRPMKDHPNGIGPKASHDALANHKEGDSHPASAIVITDSGAYFTGNDVEAALQELGAAAGVTLSDDTPLVESGSGDEGTSGEASRSDHVHPADGGGGGGGWTLGIDEDGSSFANFTAASGTWASGSGIITQSDLTKTQRRTRHNTKIPLGADVVMEADIRFPSASQSGTAVRRGGLLIGYDGANGTNAIAPYLEEDADVIRVEREGVSTTRSIAFTIAQDTWYTLRIVTNGFYVSVYADGTLLGTTLGISLEETADYVGLYAYGARVDFRDIKAYYVTLP